MDKPRICEVLGVEVDEEFTYDFGENLVNRRTFKIGANGKRYYRDETGNWRLCYSEESLNTIINHPEHIICKPKLGQEEKKANKSLKDWTLGKVKEYCTGRDCYDGCELAESPGKCKILDALPCKWNLGEKPRFTEQEVEDAKAIKRLLTEYTGVKRVEHQWGTDLLLTSEESEEFAIEPKLFPSIKSGQLYTVDEIIGGAE